MPVDVPADFAELTGVDDRLLVSRWGTRPVNIFYLTERPSDHGLPEHLARYRLPVEASLKLNDIVIDERDRGTGIGSQLLDAAVRYADLKGLPVWMCVAGEGRGEREKMNTERLVAWYTRYGFEMADDVARRRFEIDCRSHQEMVRYPHGWAPSFDELLGNI